MNHQDPIFVTSPGNLVGGAVVRRLYERGYAHVVAEDGRVDLTDLRDTQRFLAEVRPQAIVDCWALHGGIGFNQLYPADLMVDNLLRVTSLVRAAHTERVPKLLYLASACSYPKLCPQPMRPAHLMTSQLEPTNEPYGTAKLAGIQLCVSHRRQYGDDFIVGIPANPYGTGDDFTLEGSHVIGALVRKMHDARGAGRRSVEVWGTGAAVREFIFADDLADACIVALERYSSDVPLNLGGCESVSIADLAEVVREVVGFEGSIEYDRTKTDGMPLKSLDGAVLRALGWRPRTSLREGIAAAYAWFLAREGGR